MKAKIQLLHEIIKISRPALGLTLLFCLSATKEVFPVLQSTCSVWNGFTRYIQHKKDILSIIF